MHKQVSADIGIIAATAQSCFVLALVARSLYPLTNHITISDFCQLRLSCLQLSLCECVYSECSVQHFTWHCSAFVNVCILNVAYCTSQGIAIGNRHRCLTPPLVQAIL